MTAAPFDLAAARLRLSRSRGKTFWASLEEIVDHAAFREWLDAEFPSAAPVLQAAGRREFLKVMGASLLLAGLTGCGESRSDLALPYVDQPEDITPGVPRYFATAVTFEGYAQPVLATVHAGRPTKLDGNPQHPVTRGASDIFMQAALLQLYDPDRSQTPRRGNGPATWDAFERELADMRATWRARKGEGLRILIGETTSPTLERQLRRFLSELPGARLHRFEPAGLDERRAAMRLAFGRDLDPHYRLDRCDVIVSLEDDLLGPGIDQVTHGRDWSAHRGEARPGQGRGRLHVAESVPTLTGVVASTRLIVEASRIEHMAHALAARLGAETSSVTLSEAESKWADMATQELRAHRGRSLLTVGAHAPAAIQALAPWLNEQLGNAGQTVQYTEPVASLQAGSLSDLAGDMAAGAVDTLVMVETNPAYAAPEDLRFPDLLKRVRHRIYAGLYHDETAMLCDWHVPLAHALESFADARAIDGTVTIIQPVVLPFYAVRTAHQLCDMLLGATRPDAAEPVRATWRERFGAEFDTRWRQSLHDGFVDGTAAAPIAATAARPQLAPPSDTGIDMLDVVFRPDPTIRDGRFAGTAWLQELPKPISKIAWDNVVQVSPRFADQMGLRNGDLVEVEVNGQRVTGPAWITPGQAARTVALFLGYGRRHAGRVGSDIGYSAYAVQPAQNPWHARGTLRRLDQSHPVATTQLHHRIDAFGLVREVTADAPDLPAPKPAMTLYPEWPDNGPAWAMVIDLDLCIGCNACVLACVAENNIAVVGKEQVAMGREMHWLRVDRYYTGDVENPRSSFQPVPCMHCEKAPCEMGCPVHATVHSPDGINQMVYNRCIGTRTCSSYCPYKVRRFNWFDYRAPADSPTHAAHNPDVTVRSRGVMEKCTYCTQRIQAARVKADKENRGLTTDEVKTACQQACPTTAIVFGDLNDPKSAVAQRRRSGRQYALLEELGTRPRTTYLARWNDESEGGS